MSFRISNNLLEYMKDCNYPSFLNYLYSKLSLFAILRTALHYHFSKPFLVTARTFLHPRFTTAIWCGKFGNRNTHSTLKFLWNIRKRY